MSRLVETYYHNQQTADAGHVNPECPSDSPGLPVLSNGANFDTVVDSGEASQSALKST